MSSGQDPSDKATFVRTMFGRLAARYDLLNDLMTGGLHRLWKRKAIAELDPQPGDLVLDGCCGTGDIAHRIAAMCPDCEVLGVDFSEPMLAKARARGDSSNLRFWAGNVCHLVQLDDGSCQRVIVGFGLRNVADFRSALAELWRVTKRGGRIVILDLSQPRGLWGRASSWYRYRLVPWLGKAVAGDGEAYTYLPNSVDSYLDQEQLRSLMELVGWREVRYQNLLGGVLAIHSGLK